MRFLFSPYGRTARLGFWIFIVIYVAMTFGSKKADEIAGTYNSSLDLGVIETLVGLFLLWPSIAVPVRRFHDLGMSGWWVLWIVLITAAAMAVGLWVAVTFAGSSIETFEAVDGNTSLEDLPLGIWIVIAFAAIPILVQYFMLGFMRGEEEENRFDLNSEFGRSHKQDDTPPWTDR